MQKRAWAHTYTYGGNGYARTGQLKQAFSWYVKALRTQPHYVPAWQQLAKLAVRPLRRAAP